MKSVECVSGECTCLSAAVAALRRIYESGDFKKYKANVAKPDEVVEVEPIPENKLVVKAEYVDNVDPIKFVKWLLFDTMADVKGVPPRYFKIILKITKGNIADFLKLGGIKFSDEAARCGKFLLSDRGAERLYQYVNKDVYMYWAVHSIQKVGEGLRIVLIRPAL